MSLPKWIINTVPTGYETKDGQSIIQLCNALVIAWEALEIEASGSCNGVPNGISKAALRRIDELGREGK